MWFSAARTVRPGCEAPTVAAPKLGVWGDARSRVKVGPGADAETSALGQGNTRTLGFCTPTYYSVRTYATTQHTTLPGGDIFIP